MNNSDIEQQNTHPAPAKYTVIESHTLSCSMQITCRTQVQSSCFVCRQRLFAPEGESLIYRAAGPPVQHHSGRRSFSLMSNLVRNVYIISTQLWKCLFASISPKVQRVCVVLRVDVQSDKTLTNPFIYSSQQCKVELNTVGMRLD